MPTPSSLKHKESLSPIYNDLPLANPDSVQLGEEASGVEGHVNNSGTTRMSSDSNYLALGFDAGISGRRGVRYGTGRILKPGRSYDLGKVFFSTLQSSMRNRRWQRYGRRVLKFDVSVFRLAIARSDFYPRTKGGAGHCATGTGGAVLLWQRGELRGWRSHIITLVEQGLVAI
ncbi:hypothetical protein V2G26_019463 [Clonostachys chloroleuca]